MGTLCIAKPICALACLAGGAALADEPMWEKQDCLGLRGFIYEVSQAPTSQTIADSGRMVAFTSGHDAELKELYDQIQQGPQSDVEILETIDDMRVLYKTRCPAFD